MAGVTNQLEPSASVVAYGSTLSNFEAVGAPFGVPGFGLTTTQAHSSHVEKPNAYQLDS